VFIDEAGSHTAMTRTHARAPKGQRAYGSVPRNRGGNLTLLAALSKECIQAEWLIEGSVDGTVFVTWLERVLLPTLTPGHVVVMDNLRAHYRKEVRALIEAHGCRLLYLPPYSPDFSPIELAFSKIKGQLKSFAARTRQALTDAIAEACCTVGSADVAGWFRHCGYNLQ
jgi:transposase